MPKTIDNPEQYVQKWIAMILSDEITYLAKKNDVATINEILAWEDKPEPHNWHVGVALADYRQHCMEQGKYEVSDFLRLFIRNVLHFDVIDLDCGKFNIREVNTKWIDGKYRCPLCEREKNE